MTDLTKLADALDNTGSRATSLTPDQRMEIYEAACILRAAASVDVAGLMELAAKAIYDQWADQLGWVEWVPGGNSLNQDEARSIARAALESALRMALAARVPEESDGWIAIPEGGMPPLGEQVLVWCKYGPHWGPMVDCWDEQHEAPVSFSSATIPIGPGWDSGSDFEHVTHWRPIAAPKGTP